MAKELESSGTIPADVRNAKLEAERKKLERIAEEADVVYQSFVEAQKCSKTTTNRPKVDENATKSTRIQSNDPYS